MIDIYIYIARYITMYDNLSPCITILRHALHANAMDHEFHEFHALIYHVSYCFGWHGQADQVGTCVESDEIDATSKCRLIPS